MKQRVLIACMGNIFLGDDAFGLEVAKVLATGQPVPEVCVHDFGIRSFDLAYALLEEWEAVILVDAVSRGGAPGTLYTIEVDPSQAAVENSDATFDAHSMDPVAVIRLAMTMGAINTRLYVVGCEPADLGGEEGRMGLTEPLQLAVIEAANMVEELAGRLLQAAPA